MREIMFKGKVVGQDKWVYGYLQKMFGNIGIQDLKDENVFYNVCKNTVGQFTGLHDKNGKEIYDGDIIKLDTDDDMPYAIEWADYLGCWYFNILSKALSEYMHIDKLQGEVIGNVWDNKELLDVE